MSDKRLDISSGAVFIFACVYFLDGLSGLGALLLAVFVHEAGHALAIKLLGGKITLLRFEASGLCMGETGLSDLPLFFALLAGPAAGLALAYLCSAVGAGLSSALLLKTGGLSLLLTIYNLLPASPLDGGRALGIVLARLIGAHAAGNALFFTGLVSGLLLCAGGIIIRSAALFAAGFWIFIAQTGIVKSLRVM